MDSIELFVTIIHKDSDPFSADEEEQCPSFLECLIGSDQCNSAANSIYISDEVRSSILNEELFQVHANFGCVILHMCKDSIDVMGKFLVFYAEEEPVEVMRKDSDLSSDDSDTYPVQVTGLAINPSKPDVLKNINLQDFLSPDHKSKEEGQKQHKKNKRQIRKSQIVHTHTEIPNIVKSNTVESEFHQLKPAHGFPKIKASLSVFYFCINIYSGNDFMHKARQGSLRNALNSIQIKSENLGIIFSKFPKKLHYS